MNLIIVFLVFSLQYIHAAALYFNCSCYRTRMNYVSQNSEATKRNLSEGTSSVQTRNFDEPASNSSHLTRLKIINNQGDVWITQQKLNVPYSSAYHRTCQSFKVQTQSDFLENKRNICDVCHTCQLKTCKQVFGLSSFMNSDIALTSSFFSNGCSTIRPLYYTLVLTSICCTVQMTQTTKGSGSSLERIKTVSLESLREIERSLDDIINELFSSIIPPFRRTGYNQAKGHSSLMEPHVGTKNPLPQSSSLVQKHDSLDDSSTDNVSNRSCVPTGHVTQFTGAGCHSNRSVNFFLMDSTEYWGVAERLGVNSTHRDKVALVIADLEVK